MGRVNGGGGVSKLGGGGGVSNLVKGDRVNLNGEIDWKVD